MTTKRSDSGNLDGQTLGRILGEAASTLRASEWAPLLTYHGVDILDVLAAPLYQALLQSARRCLGESPNPPDKSASSWNKFRTRFRYAAHRLKHRYLSHRAARRGEPAHQADYLFWPRNAHHFGAQRPVIDELRKRNASTGVLTSHPSIFAEVRRRGESAIFGPGSWPAAAAEARREGRRLADSPTFFAANPQLDAPMKLPAGISLSELIRSVVVRSLPDACEAIVHAEQAIEQLSPRVLIVGYDMTIEGRAACLVGRSRRVPTAVLMQGSFSGTSILKSHVADRLLVYGNAHRRDLQAAGVPLDRIAVCGAPYLDRCPQQSHKLDGRIVKQFGLDLTKPYIFVATSGPGHAVSVEHHQETVEAITRLSSELPHCQMVVKLHPKDSLSYYNAAQSRYPQSRLHVVPHGTDGLPTQIFDWFQGCAALLTGASATAFEAMVLDVPVISIDLRREFCEVSFIEAGATAHVRTYAELNDAVRRVTQDTSEADKIRLCAKPFLSEMFFALDGRSSERAADLVTDLANFSNHSCLGSWADQNRDA